ncbi:MAG: iron-containing alcohol dehydrogenase [Lachnospiraceae bacterium]|nr:iron-containing alcohol dehydrogenase [Lachnospiraceae bacterium]MBQ2453119.1 iron-containing alcohol dehydrogenase [Lachnospiraceae bacterium]
MNNYAYHVPTDIRFGKDQILCLAEEIGKYGKKVLLVYGGGSIKKSGLYDKVYEVLKGFEIFELPGIEPNPKLTSVKKGADICKENGIDAVLAVGGGSTIDASKHIACAAFYEGDPWDLVLDKTKVTKALPIFTVLTISATGSEMNPGAVISNEETKEKLEINHPLLYPTLSVCDPTYQFTLPKKQTAAGTVDILSHIMEQYFQPNDGAYITDRLSEAAMKTCIKYGPIAIEEPENYEARSNLMWTGSIALNHLFTFGKGGAWSVHPIEHELSAFYDITHGVGLAILTPAWMEYVLSEATVKRFATYARNVWDVTEKEDIPAAKAGIYLTERFFIELGMPEKLSEIGIDDSQFKEMADEAIRTSGLSTRAYVRLDASDVEQIYRECL